MIKHKIISKSNERANVINRITEGNVWGGVWNEPVYIKIIIIV